MALGEKLFEETGKVSEPQVKSVHPIEGVKMEVSFSNEIKGVGKFPSGRNMGSGTVTHYPSGAVNARYQGVATLDGDNYIWWANEKSRRKDGGGVKGIVIVSGYTNSQKLSWLTGKIIVIESEIDTSFQQYRGTGYEWK